MNNFHKCQSMSGTYSKINHPYTLLHNFIISLHQDMSNACHFGNDFEIKSPLTFLIDSFPGTNITLFLSDFGKSIDNGLIHLKKRNSLVDNSSDPNITSYTYNEFMLQCFNINYEEYCKLFGDSDDSESKKIYKLLDFLNNFQEIQLEAKVVVLDEYPSAWLLVLIYLTCKKYKLHLIYIDDNRYIKKKFGMAAHLSEHQISLYLLHKFQDIHLQYPQCGITVDRKLSNDLEEFTELLAKKSPKNDVELTFDLLYFLFTKFETKFYKRATDFNSETIFMAHCHEGLKSQLLKYEGLLECSSKVEYKKSYYCYYKNYKYNNISVSESEKYLPYVILVKGDKYIYTGNYNEPKKIVTLLNINLKENNVTIRDGNNIFKLNRRIMSKYHICNELRDILTRDMPIGETDIHQFPLKPYNVCTYYAAQCLTVPIQYIELDLNGTPANSVYVALSRINSANQISKMHSQELGNLMVTKYFEKVMNDKAHYYKTPDEDKIMKEVLLENLQLPSPSVIEELKENHFREVHDISEFKDNPKGKIKIKRSKYDEIKPEHLQDTNLISITRFLKEKFDYIMTNDNISFDDLDAKYGEWMNYTNNGTSTPKKKLN